MTVLLGCGGTGGHISPAMALAEELMTSGYECIMVGAFNEHYRQLLRNQGFNYRLVSVSRGVGSLVSLRTCVLLWQSLRECVKLFREYRKTRPGAVVCFGGYAALPLVFAAVLLKVPVIIHEQNVIPGRLNRLFSRFADRIALSHVESQPYFKGRTLSVTGNPVRKGLFAYSKTEARNKLNINDDGRKTLAVLILGGSQGSSTLNKAAAEAFRGARNKGLHVFLIHITGESEYGQYTDLYAGYSGSVFCQPFYEDMGLLYGAADVIVCRAGASTLSECTCFGLPAVIVPYPYAADNHQYHNAVKLEKAGCAHVYEDSMFTGAVLLKELESFIVDSGLYKTMAQASRKCKNRDAAGWLKKVVETCIG